MKGMLCFNGSCWCCVNSKSLFACQNADVDFRSFELALTSSDEFLLRSNGAKCACCVSKTTCLVVKTCQDSQERGRKMYIV